MEETMTGVGRMQLSYLLCPPSSTYVAIYGETVVDPDGSWIIATKSISQPWVLCGTPHNLVQQCSRHSMFPLYLYQKHMRPGCGRNLISSMRKNPGPSCHHPSGISIRKHLDVRWEGSWCRYDADTSHLFTKYMKLKENIFLPPEPEFGCIFDCEALYA